MILPEINIRKIKDERLSQFIKASILWKTWKSFLKLYLNFFLQFPWYARFSFFLTIPTEMMCFILFYSSASCVHRQKIRFETISVRFPITTRRRLPINNITTLHRTNIILSFCSFASIIFFMIIRKRNEIGNVL